MAMSQSDEEAIPVTAALAQQTRRPGRIPIILGGG
jgi:hypothetical protein